MSRTGGGKGTNQHAVRGRSVAARPAAVASPSARADASATAAADPFGEDPGTVTTPDDPKADLGRLRDELADDGVRLSAYATRDGSIDVGVLSVDEDRRGQGLAADAMRRVCDLADRHQVRVTLTPTDEFGASKKRLADFYKRHGFVENKGRNKDFSTRAAMYRDPQG